MKVRIDKKKGYYRNGAAYTATEMSFYLPDVSVPPDQSKVSSKLQFLPTADPIFQIEARPPGQGGSVDQTNVKNKPPSKRFLFKSVTTSSTTLEVREKQKVAQYICAYVEERGSYVQNGRSTLLSHS